MNNGWTLGSLFPSGRRRSAQQELDGSPRGGQSLSGRSSVGEERPCKQDGRQVACKTKTESQKLKNTLWSGPGRSAKVGVKVGNINITEEQTLDMI